MASSFLFLSKSDDLGNPVRSPRSKEFTYLENDYHKLTILSRTLISKNTAKNNGVKIIFLRIAI